MRWIRESFLPLQPASTGGARVQALIQQHPEPKKRSEKLLAKWEKVLTFASASRGSETGKRAALPGNKKGEKNSASGIAKRKKAFTFAPRK
ncbi:hypothetical protein, partial [Pontibacter akesuensis]|uniref:hypothetical protein n=1 Tax=Pontibacter akesuensis TaxID=388950 RepID=UPI001E2DC8C9